MAADDVLQLLVDGAEKEKTEIPSDDVIESIGSLAIEMQTIDKELEELAAEAERLSARRLEIATKLLPERLRAAKIPSFKLEDGSEVASKTNYYANIKEETRAAAHQWLRDNGCDIIKNEFKLAFGKGEEDHANILKELLTSEGYSFNCKEAVHPQTLQAFVRERIENQKELPMDTFGVHVVNEAVIKPPEQAKKGK